MTRQPGHTTTVSRLFARNTDLTLLFDAFLISAITTILVNRLVLVILDYPQIGGRGLHIAHLLWGGLLMLIALLGLLLFLGRRRRVPLAIVGGIGMGLFVDEIGKFVTADNDYFFRPAPALIYLVFVIVYMVVRALSERGRLSSEEYIANVIDTLQDGALNDIDEAELEEAFEMLDAAGHHAWTPHLRTLLEAVRDLPPRRPSRLSWLTASLRRWYVGAIETPALQTLTVLVFGLHAVTSLAQVIGIFVTVNGAWDGPMRDHFIERFTQDTTGVGVLAWLSTVTSVLSSALVLTGFWLWRRSRVEAYRMFERSLLLSIFVVQPLTFYEESFLAVGVLAFNLTLLACVQYAIRLEQTRGVQTVHEQHPHVSTAPAEA